VEVLAEEVGRWDFQLSEVGQGEQGGEERRDFGAALGILPEGCVEVFD